MAQLNLDENITCLIQSDEYARRLAKSLELTGGNDWFLDYVEHYKKKNPAKGYRRLKRLFYKLNKNRNML